MNPHPEKSLDPLVKAFRFNDLPERIRKKIRVHGSKKVECWKWIGYVRPGGQRFKRYKTPDDYDGHRNFTGCYENEQPLPQVHDPRSGNKVAAHRVIYSLITCTPIGDVPRLARCNNPLCVSPYHVTEEGPSPNQTKDNLANQELGDVPVKPVMIAVSAQVGHQTSAPLQMSCEDVCKKLFEVEPIPDIGPEAAAEECGVDPDTMKEIWPDYVEYYYNRPTKPEDN